MPIRSKSNSKISNISGLKKVFHWLRTIDESIHYDPIDSVAQSQVGMAKQFEHLQARLHKLESNPHAPSLIEDLRSSDKAA